MGEHALLSASSAARWLNCPASARLNENLPDTTSVYAEEGTQAHTAAEKYLRNAIGDISDDDLNDWILSVGGVDTEMEDHVNAYVKYVLAQPGDVTLVEQRLDYGEWVPEGFGTGDAIRIGEGLLTVIDFKYGRGVPVMAENNPQLKLYALGALSIADMFYDVDAIAVHIFQPRVGAPTSTTYSVEELRKWGDSIRKVAWEAWEGTERRSAGGWCRFCKVKPVCRERAESEAVAVFNDTAIAEGLDPQSGLLTDDEIVRLLNAAEPAIKFLQDLQKYALSAACAGKQWKGWKLVEGRSNRSYKDEKAVLDALVEANIPRDLCLKAPQLLGLTELKKTVGNKVFTTVVEPMLIKPPGKPTLVRENDKRRAMSLDAAAAAAVAFIADSEDFED